jgi:hypothetical protein
VSFGDRQGSSEAASTLPQASALLPGAGFMAGFSGRHRWSRKLLQTPEDLGSALFIQTHPDQLASVIIQRPVAAVLPDRHRVSPLEGGQSVCPAPGWRYLSLHQPSAVLWDHQERPSLWFCVIGTPCLLHQPVGAPSAQGALCSAWVTVQEPAS